MTDVTPLQDWSIKLNEALLREVETRGNRRLPPHAQIGLVMQQIIDDIPEITWDALNRWQMGAEQAFPDEATHEQLLKRFEASSNSSQIKALRTAWKNAVEHGITTPHENIKEHISFSTKYVYPRREDKTSVLFTLREDKTDIPYAPGRDDLATILTKTKSAAEYLACYRVIHYPQEKRNSLTKKLKINITHNNPLKKIEDAEYLPETSFLARLYNSEKPEEGFFRNAQDAKHFEDLVDMNRRLVMVHALKTHKGSEFAQNLRHISQALALTELTDALRTRADVNDVNHDVAQPGGLVVWPTTFLTFLKYALGEHHDVTLEEAEHKIQAQLSTPDQASHRAALQELAGLLKQPEVKTWIHKLPPKRYPSWERNVRGSKNQAARGGRGE